MGRKAGITLEEKEATSKRMKERNRKAKQQAPNAFNGGNQAKTVSLETQLNDYLVDYNVRLIEIEHKYPLGNKERAEWLLAHRKNGVKRLMEIVHNA